MRVARTAATNGSLLPPPAIPAAFGSSNCPSRHQSCKFPVIHGSAGLHRFSPPSIDGMLGRINRLDGLSGATIDDDATVGAPAVAGVPAVAPGGPDSAPSKHDDGQVRRAYDAGGNWEALRDPPVIGRILEKLLTNVKSHATVAGVEERTGTPATFVERAWCKRPCIAGGPHFAAGLDWAPLRLDLSSRAGYGSAESITPWRLPTAWRLKWRRPRADRCRRARRNGERLEFGHLACYRIARDRNDRIFDRE